MRPFGSLIDRTIQLSQPPIPDPRLERVNPPVMIALDEGITELFDRACVSGELDAAADLLALLERWQARRAYANDQQRRLAGVHLRRMHGELERRHIMRGTRLVAHVRQPLQRTA